MLKRKAKYVVAVVGATGAAGDEIILTLEQRDFPVGQLRLFASENSGGESLPFREQEIPVDTLQEDSFKGVDIALFSAGAEQSGRWAPVAAASGCVVVDDSAYWRKNQDIPLVVPEVNAHDLLRHRGIIAIPGSSTIQMVLVLKPIHDAARIRRVVATTFQSVSGTGRGAMEELFRQTADILNFRPVQTKVYHHQIAFNCFPRIGGFLENGSSNEEMNIVNETRRVVGDPAIRITATAVRVPVFRCHAESLNIETENKIAPDEMRAILSSAPGVVVYDAPDRDIYPVPVHVAGKDEVWVGRIRGDESVENGLNLWVVADNLRKGGALTAVQIAERLVEMAREGRR